MIRSRLTFQSPVKNTLTRYFNNNNNNNNNNNKNNISRISTDYYSYRIKILIEAHCVICAVNANKVNFSTHDNKKGAFYMLWMSI